MPVMSSSKTYDCGLCGAAFQSNRALENHLCLMHDQCGSPRPGAEITFRCAACGSAYARRSELLAHMESSGHGRPHGADDARPATRRGARGAARGKVPARS